MHSRTDPPKHPDTASQRCFGTIEHGRIVNDDLDGDIQRFLSSLAGSGSWRRLEIFVGLDDALHKIMAHDIARFEKGES